MFTLAITPASALPGYDPFKYIAVFYSTSYRVSKVVPFGNVHEEDYTQHQDHEKRMKYVKEHDWEKGHYSDGMHPRTLNRFILYKYPHVDVAVEKYKRKFNYN